VQVLHDRFEANPNITVLAVHFDDRGSEPAEYMEEHGYTYRLIPNGGDVAREFSVSEIPAYIVVGKDGRVAHSQIGRLTDESREKLAEAALAAAGSS
jgi:heptaprenylglyceryl phosphate synthase